jgi:hypothetical protein
MVAAQGALVLHLDDALGTLIDVGEETAHVSTLEVGVQVLNALRYCS